MATDILFGCAVSNSIFRWRCVRDTLRPRGTVNTTQAPNHNVGISEEREEGKAKGRIGEPRIRGEKNKTRRWGTRNVGRKRVLRAGTASVM